MRSIWHWRHSTLAIDEAEAAGCDILLTWNCLHLANANKFGHIKRVNALLGLKIPILATPNQLLKEYNESS